MHVFFLHDFIMLLTFNMNGRLNPQNEAAKRGLERLEKQMKVCSFFKKIYIYILILMLNYISLLVDYVTFFFFLICK